MKTTIMSALLTAATALGFAAEPLSANELPLQVKRSLAEDRVTSRNWFGYMRMGLSDSRPTDVKNVLPGLGAGARYSIGSGAIDLSASYTGDNPFVDQTETYFYTVPRLSYLYYATPSKEQSFFGGAGLAYGGLKSSDTTLFNGLIPSISLGYEMNRLQNWRSFVQLDISQPAVATASSKPFAKMATWSLGPIAELAFGFGY